MNNNALVNYRQSLPTWVVLQRQYSQEAARRTFAGVIPAQPMMSAGTFFASAITVGSLLVILGNSSKTEKAVAMQLFSIAAPVALGKLFQIQ